MTEHAVAETKKKKAVITISKRLCSGCKICVEMCPEKVLAMVNEPSKVSGEIAGVVNLDACIKCMLCEVHCPDFAIKVE